jgi:hypothetical protein
MSLDPSRAPVRSRGGDHTLDVRYGPHFGLMSDITPLLGWALADTEREQLVLAVAIVRWSKQPHLLRDKLLCIEGQTFGK